MNDVLGKTETLMNFSLMRLNILQHLESNRMCFKDELLLPQVAKVERHST